MKSSLACTMNRLHRPRVYMKWTSLIQGILLYAEAHWAGRAPYFRRSYTGILKTILETYINSYVKMDSSLTVDTNNPVARVNKEMLNSSINISNNPLFAGVTKQMGSVMTEAKMNKEILTKVSELTSKITKSFANSFNVDPSKITGAFKLKYSEEEIRRIISAMLTNNESNSKSNLISFGYQDLEEPTLISFYFNSFEGKENFLNFLDNYNEEIEKVNKDKKINYSDTTGILMNSVKTIVDAVSYVLIGFVSISLVVSSIMIGIITYISVFERTKEIGILRSIGASKHNISSIFNAETFIIGLLSGLFGIGISYMLIPIINSLIHHFTGNIPLNAYLSIKNASILVTLSVILTLIGGFIPSRSAAKKDPVEALRSE